MADLIGSCSGVARSTSVTGASVGAAGRRVLLLSYSAGTATAAATPAAATASRTSLGPSVEASLETRTPTTTSVLRGPRGATAV